MKLNTLKNILEQTKNFHQRLSICMTKGANETTNIRAKLLLDYLSSHEQTLAHIIEKFSQTANHQALDTWCYEYLEKNSDLFAEQSDQCSFAKMDSTEIISEIIKQHNQLIAFYKYLYLRAEVSSTKELLEQLTSLEQHQAMQIAHSANRLEDL